jgi:hypothetical protein
MPRGQWRSYADVSEAPQSVQDKVREQQDKEPIAVIEIKIYGTGAGQATVSVGVSQEGPFAAFGKMPASPRQRAAQDIFAVASRELATGMRLLGSM